jgi:hypothetical protein
LWTLYRDALTWNCRPSNLLAIEDAYLAYCVDQACAYWGRSIQYELDQIDAKDNAEAEYKTQQILDRYLDEPDEAPKPGRFADPMIMM